MPRKPIELTDEQIQIVQNMAAKLTQGQMSDFLGISEKTFREIMHRDERVSTAYKKGKAQQIARVAGFLFDKCEAGDTASIIFFLKTQAGWRETDREVTELPQIKIVKPDETD